MSNDDKKDTESGKTLDDELREAIRQGVREGIEDSGLPKLVNARKRITKITGMYLDARECMSQGDYQKASDLYSQLAEIDEDEKRKEIYLRRVQEALDLISK